MSDETRAYLVEGVDDVLADIEMLEAIADAGTVGDLDKGPDRKRARKHHELEDTADLTEALDTIALEVYGTARVDGNGTTLQSVTIVTGTGGPHIEVELDADGDAFANGWWGSEHADRRRAGIGAAVAETVAEWLGVSW